LILKLLEDAAEARPRALQAEEPAFLVLRRNAAGLFFTDTGRGTANTAGFGWRVTAAPKRPFLHSGSPTVLALVSSFVGREKQVYRQGSR
jgi:hypothetical protein